MKNLFKLTLIGGLLSINSMAMASESSHFKG